MITAATARFYSSPLTLLFQTTMPRHQMPPVVVGMQVTGISLRTILGLSLSRAAFSIAVLPPRNHLWWRLIGYFG